MEEPIMASIKAGVALSQEPGLRQLRAFSCVVVESRLIDVASSSHRPECDGRTGDMHSLVEDSCSS
jgi:hypothetical protein